jgi:choline-sulfatase
MRRTGLIAAIVAVAAAAAALAGWRLTRPAARATVRGPVILISIDTLRADHLPVYGYAGVRTPAIDALAAASTIFDHAYTHATQTLPAHASILTGALPFETGVRDNIGFSLKEGQWTLPAALKAQGWATGGFVSAYVLRGATKIDQGFDVYDSNLPAASSETPLGQVQRNGADTVAAAIKWFDARTSDRVFLFVHLYEPHRPYTPPARFSSYAPYDGEIAYADEIVGQLLDHLRAANLFDQSTIVLLSDHGEGLGDHGEEEHGMFLYDSTTHVPLIIKMPGQKRSRRIAAPVQHIDIAPTILAAVGAPVPASLHGRNLAAAIDGGALAPVGVYAEAMLPRYHFGWSELYSLTDDRYKYIRAPRDELYDLQTDAREETSIAGSRPQVRDAMHAALQRFIAGTPLPAPSAVTDADRQRLAALGYVGSAGTATLGAAADTLPDPKDKAPALVAYQRANDLAGEMKFAEAIETYRAVLSANPEMVDVWGELAQVYIRLGRSADAVDAFRHVIERNPKDAPSLLGAGSQSLHMGKLDDAQKYGELAVAVAPAFAHDLLARIAVKRHDAVTARREAALAEEADPTLPMKEIVEGMLLYDAGRYAECLPHFGAAEQMLLKRTVQVQDINYYIGDSLARLGRYPEAERFLKGEIVLFPFNIRARAGLAMLYRASGRDADSEQAIADLLGVAPSGEGREVARQLYLMFGEPGKAAALKPAGKAR